MRALTFDNSRREHFVFREVQPRRLSPNEVLVRVSAVTVDPREIEAALRNGGDGLPFGSELVGTVEECAPDGSGPPRGSRVVGLVASGAWAELVAVPSDALAEVPSDVTLTGAVTLPVAGLTALHALSYGGLLAAKHVLVANASGAIGLFAVQLAHLSGACVTAMVSLPEHEALLEEYGADCVLVEGTSAMGPFGPYHLIVGDGDDIVPETTTKVLRPWGTYACYGSDQQAARVPGGADATGPSRGARVSVFELFNNLQLEPAREGLRRLLALVRTNSLQPHVETEAGWVEAEEIAAIAVHRDYVGRAVLHL